MTGFSLDNFLYTHLDFVHPDVIFESDVSLQGLDQSNIWFCLAQNQIESEDSKTRLVQ